MISLAPRFHGGGLRGRLWPGVWHTRATQF